MKTEILYVELKNDGHRGDAWIGYGQFSKSGQSIYFDGKVLKKGQGSISNYFDIENGDLYWVSKIKKDGTDRHSFGSGKIFMDRSAVNEYLQFISASTLPKNKFILVDISHVPNKQLATEIENAKLNKYGI